jgi:plastocyanin
MVSNPGSRRLLVAVASVVVLVTCNAPVGSTATPSASPGPVETSTVEASVQPAGSIRVEMTNYAFSPADIPLTAGRVVLYLVNSSTQIHAMALRNPAVSILNVVALSAEIQAGRSAVFTIDNLRAGVYRGTCPIAGHADNGMTGTATMP